MKKKRFILSGLIFLCIVFAAFFLYFFFRSAPSIWTLNISDKAKYQHFTTFFEGNKVSIHLKQIPFTLDLEEKMDPEVFIIDLFKNKEGYQESFALRYKTIQSKDELLSVVQTNAQNPNASQFLMRYKNSFFKNNSLIIFDLHTVPKHSFTFDNFVVGNDITIYFRANSYLKPGQVSTPSEVSYLVAIEIPKKLVEKKEILVYANCYLMG